MLEKAVAEAGGRERKTGFDSRGEIMMVDRSIFDWGREEEYVYEYEGQEWDDEFPRPILLSIGLVEDRGVTKK